MKSFVHINDECKLMNMKEPVASNGEVVVKLLYAGLNRRDLYIPGRRGIADEPLTLGSDGAGIIKEIGEGVENWSVGDEVIINPALRWNENSDAPPASFDILGMPDNGTFAEKIVISADQIEPKPAHLTFAEASVVALAGLTGYRAMFTKGKLKKGETVLIPGAGSGVATFLIQFAKNIGARVITTSRSAHKREQALQLGANIAIDTASNWQEELKNEQIDLVIDSIGKSTFEKSLSVLKKGGRFVTFGATTEDIVQFDLRAFFYGQYQLIGSTMGSREELRAMLEHMKIYEMKPVIDREFTLAEGNEALKYLEINKQFGKLVFNISE